MIIWKGFGFLVVVLAVAGFLVAQLAVNGYTADDHYYQTHHWPKLLGAGVAAVPIWFLGRFLNRRPGRVLVDPATGETVTPRATHDLFFIRMELWAPILLAIALVIALAAR